MLKIGRYKVAFGRVVWLQTRVPTRVWHFLWFWFFREARPWDVDKKQQFPQGTSMEHEGRVYRYWRAPCTLPKGSWVTEDGLVKDGEVKIAGQSEQNTGKEVNNAECH